MRTGTISDLGLLTLLSELHRSRFTGQLLLGLDPQHLLFLREGAVVHVVGSKEGGRLGEVLVELGTLSAKNHAFSLAIKPPDGLRYGSIVLRYGMAPAAAIAAALREQMLRRLLPILLMKGDFEVAAGEHQEGLLADGTPVRLDLRQVLFGGTTALSQEQLAALLSPLHRVPVRLREDTDLTAFGLREDDDWVPEHLRVAPISPSDLSALPRGKRALSVLGALWLGDALDVGAAAMAGAAPRPARPARTTGPQAVVASPEPAATEGRGADPALLLIDLDYLRAHLAQEDLFGVLGLPLNTHTAVIQRALSAALSEYSDESLARHGLAAHAETARAVRLHLQHAAERLREREVRQVYLDDLMQRRAAAVDPGLAQARGERLGARARVLLSRERFATAAMEADAALRLLPGRWDLEGLRTYARYAAGRMSATRAARTLEEARGAAPECADLHYLAGLLAQREGREDDAWAALSEALARDPAHKEAAQLQQTLRGKRQAGKALEPITLMDALRQPVGPGVMDALRRPLSGIASTKEPEPTPAPTPAPAPVSLLEVLKQPVGAGLLSAMRRPLSGFAPAKDKPNDNNKDRDNEKNDADTRDKEQGS